MNRKYKLLRRITITGKMEEVQLALDFCLRNGYRTSISGPMPIARFKVDPSRFRIIADQEIKNW